MSKHSFLFIFSVFFSILGFEYGQGVGSVGQKIPNVTDLRAQNILSSRDALSLAMRSVAINKNILQLRPSLLGW
jgi:hypothetical protein